MLTALGVGGVGAVVRTVNQNSSCLSPRRTVTYSMHALSASGRLHAQQRPSSSGAAAAATAPACVNLPRTCRGALASTSTGFVPVLSQAWRCMPGVSQVRGVWTYVVLRHTSLARGLTQASPTVLVCK
jgi:hypothetical protein